MFRLRTTQLLLIVLVVFSQVPPALCEPETGSPSVITLSRDDTEGHKQSLELQLSIKQGRVEGQVLYSENNALLLIASVDLSENGVSSTGFVFGEPFEYSVLGIHDSNSATIESQVGDAVFCPMIDGARTGEAVLDRQKTALDAVVARNGASVLVDRMAALLSDVVLDDLQKRILLVAAVSAVGGAAHTNGWIEDYVGCLKDECSGCGGCWSGGCHYCAGSGFWAGSASFVCYTIGAEMCFVQFILDPLDKGLSLGTI